MTTDTDTEVGRRVRAARWYKGLRSVPKLAKAINENGLRATTLYEIERGERHAEKRELQAIATACGLPAEFFKMDFWEAADALGERSEVSRLRADVEELQEQLRRLEAARSVAAAEAPPRTGEGAPPKTGRPPQSPLP